MTVGLLIIAHDGVGDQLIKSARGMLGLCPLNAEVINVSQHSDVDSLFNNASEACDRLNDGAGVLILTDVYGSTPSNIAIRLLKHDTAVVAGLNLPMLIRVLNYPKLNLEQLAQKALSGGRDGVLLCREDPWS